MSSNTDLWPSLPWDEWKDTATTLHMWTQIVGKTRLALSPPLNHWWNVALYVSPRGLTTSLIPYGAEAFDIEFDFIEHRLAIRTSWGEPRFLMLHRESVAEFYDEYMSLLHSLGINVDIYGSPVEVSEPIPFAEDQQHASYNPEFAHRFWRILLRADSTLKHFRGRFVGKASPVHFFWGSFDLAVTLFSGRRAPERPDADTITREAYSHEVISGGFWPGNGGFGAPAFYCYAAPEPPGFADEKIRPAAAYYDKNLKEFILKYDDVRMSDAPEAAVMEFLESAYEAGARLGNWDRKALERQGDFPSRQAASHAGEKHQARYLVSHLPDGLLLIRASESVQDPVVLNFIPRDVNERLNVDGTIPLGNFSDINSAKETASTLYTVSPDSWEVSRSPYGDEAVEEHTPIVEGHRLRPNHE